ncbi:MAG: hypothetical protein IJY50_02420 [Clostridia bacterium]|nr:hypothetical protein [Clostridia bacterium]
MNKIFPSMYSKPENGQIVALIPCWIWVFVLFPMFMPFLGAGLWEQWELSVWLEVGYHVVNGVAMFLIMRAYLKDEWFMLTTDVRYHLKHIALTVGLIAGAELIWLGALHVCGFNVAYMLDFLPLAEMTVSHTPLFLIELQPVFGTIALSVFAPFSICLLFYCLGFAPACNKNPWIAYPCVAAVTLIPCIIDILWRGNAIFMLSGYLIRLPIHLLACWSYQKTNNVWTPIFSLAITNLITSILLHIFMLG